MPITGKKVTTIELEFYIKLFKRHTEQLFQLMNEKTNLDLNVFKAIYV